LAGGTAILVLHFPLACTWPHGLASPDAGTPVNMACFALIPREATNMDSVSTLARSRTLCEQTEKLHALCAQVRRESREVTERTKTALAESRAELARSRSQGASAIPSAVA
jgi:hypothetical protein